MADHLWRNRSALETRRSATPKAHAAYTDAMPLGVAPRRQVETVAAQEVEVHLQGKRLAGRLQCRPSRLQLRRTRMQKTTVRSQVWWEPVVAD